MIIDYENISWKLSLLISGMKPGVVYYSKYAGKGPNVTRELVEKWIAVCDSRAVGRTRPFNWENMMRISNDIYRDILEGRQ